VDAIPVYEIRQLDQRVLEIDQLAKRGTEQLSCFGMVWLRRHKKASKIAGKHAHILTFPANQDALFRHFYKLFQQLK
jgi:hypothetical protein